MAAKSKTMKDVVETAALRLAVLIDLKGVTIAEAGRRTGCSEKMLDLYIAGDRPIKLWHARAFAYYFKVPESTFEPIDKTY